MYADIVVEDYGFAQVDGWISPAGGGLFGVRYTNVTRTIRDKPS